MSLILLKRSLSYKRMDRGISFLTDAKPSWPWLVNLGALELLNPYTCVAGQVFRREAKLSREPSGYTWLYRQHGSLFISEHGFNGSVSTNTWHEAINAIRIKSVTSLTLMNLPPLPELEDVPLPVRKPGLTLVS